ncbi:MAG: dihydrodipicolinate synthase family protein [Balneolales bacterium]
MTESVKGIIPPMVTPLLDDDTLDTAGLERLVEHLIGGKVDGLFLLGTTGEGPSLQYTLKEELVRRTCELVQGRVPVLVGVTDSSYRESVNMAEKAARYGAQGLVMAPPFYFQIDQEELHNHVDAFTDESPLPVYLYNMPSLTKAAFSLEMVAGLVEKPGIVGFKDSSANLTYFNKVRRLVKQGPGFSLLVGPEELLMETMIMGGDGGIPGGANIFPELYVSLHEEIRSGSVENGLRLHGRIMDLGSHVFGDTLHGSSDVINGIKCALHILGICSGHLAKPLKQASPEKAKKIRSYLENYTGSR